MSLAEASLRPRSPVKGEGEGRGQDAPPQIPRGGIGMTREKGVMSPPYVSEIRGIRGKVDRCRGVGDRVGR